MYMDKCKFGLDGSSILDASLSIHYILLIQSHVAVAAG